MKHLVRAFEEITGSETSCNDPPWKTQELKPPAMIFQENYRK
jgi:hypothetical protein